MCLEFPDDICKEVLQCQGAFRSELVHVYPVEVRAYLFEKRPARALDSQIKKVRIKGKNIPCNIVRGSELMESSGWDGVDHIVCHLEFFHVDGEIPCPACDPYYLGMRPANRIIHRSLVD